MKILRCDGSQNRIPCSKGCLLAKYLEEHHKSNIYFAMKKSELGISYVKSSFNVLTKRK